VHDEVLARAILQVGASGGPGADHPAPRSMRVSDRFRRLAR
jgi:hypothetical protein